MQGVEWLGIRGENRGSMMDQELVFTTDAFTVEEVLPQSTGDDYIDWGLHTIMAPMVWDKAKGEGIKVAVLDTGVDFNHPDLRDNLAAYVDFTQSPHGAMDIKGHGTHVAGIIAGCDNGQGIVGVAPECKLYCAKVLGDNGKGDYHALLKGLQWAIDQNVDIINMSLGTNKEPPLEFYTLIKQAHSSGIFLVASTGNENRDVCWPAKYPEVIAVSAMDKRFERAPFSNYGLENEIIAPGVNIISTYKNGKYARLSGTSMATPIVSGALALYLSYKKKQGEIITLPEVHGRLRLATVDLGKTGRDEEFGLGLINLIKLFD